MQFLASCTGGVLLKKENVKISPTKDYQLFYCFLHLTIANVSLNNNKFTNSEQLIWITLFIHQIILWKKTYYWNARGNFALNSHYLELVKTYALEILERKKKNVLSIHFQEVSSKYPCEIANKLLYSIRTSFMTTLTVYLDDLWKLRVVLLDEPTKLVIVRNNESRSILLGICSSVR